ncbi:MAG: asparaginase [Bacteroidia bacterium]|nr:asparaginase [Bacteroidia bacterium]
MNKPKILLIYTGGTIGMVQDVKTGQLKPFNFSQITEQVPELSRFNLMIDTISFENPIDSSDIQPNHWIQLIEIIEKNYQSYDGFVILHGSDTMAYTASALSFLLQNLTKPVILTGSQLPIGVIRTDGKENLITAIEIASQINNEGKPAIQEVAVYFEYTLLRGNRTIKYNSEHFDAFKSPNYPPLAEAGVTIQYNTPFLFKPNQGKLTVYKQMDNDIATVKIFPGVSRKITESILLNPEVKAIVLETFGAGNATTQPWFIEALKKATEQNKIILNITQCPEGRVMQGKYQTSAAFNQLGVIPGADLTFEAAITKLMFLLGNYSLKEARELLYENIRGEMSVL